MEFTSDKNSLARQKLLDPSRPETSQAIESLLSMINHSTENLDALNEDEIAQALDLAQKYHESTGHYGVDRTVVHTKRREIESKFSRMIDTALER